MNRDVWNFYYMSTAITEFHSLYLKRFIKQTLCLMQYLQKNLVI